MRAVAAIDTLSGIGSDEACLTFLYSCANKNNITENQHTTEFLNFQRDHTPLMFLPAQCHLLPKHPRCCTEPLLGDRWLLQRWPLYEQIAVEAPKLRL